MPTTVNNAPLAGNDYSVFVSKQTTKGAVDATPEFTPYRRVSGKGKTAVAYTASEIVNPNRQGVAQIKDGVSFGAELQSEVVKQAIDDMISAIHSANVATTVANTDIAATGTGFTSVSNEFTGLAEGDYFWAAGFSDTSLNTLYRISTKTDDGDISTYPAPAATEAAGASVTFTSNKAVNAKAQTLYAVQTRATDNSKAGNIDYHTFYDAVIDTMSLEIPETGISSYTVTMKGESEVSGSAAIAGQTTAAEPTDEPVSAVQNIKAFYVNGVDQTAIVKSLSVEHGNNYSEDKAAGVLGAVLSYGDYSLSGKLGIRSLRDNPFTWRDYNRNGTPVSIAVLIEHSDGDQTLLLVKRAIVTEYDAPDGKNVVANSECSFAAVEDPTTNTTFEIFRNWA